jgi:hypothetical protein
VNPNAVLGSEFRNGLGAPFHSTQTVVLISGIDSSCQARLRAFGPYRIHPPTTRDTCERLLLSTIFQRTITHENACVVRAQLPKPRRAVCSTTHNPLPSQVLSNARTALSTCACERPPTTSDVSSPNPMPIAGFFCRAQAGSGLDRLRRQPHGQLPAIHDQKRLPPTGTQVNT